MLLTYEATKDLPMVEHEIAGWNGAVTVDRIAGKKITVVPILRAGIGMLDGFLNLIPSAKVSVLGLERDEETLEARTYYKKLVPDVQNRIAMIIDPMLATGSSLVAAIDLLKASGCKDIRVMVFGCSARRHSTCRSRASRCGDLYCIGRSRFKPRWLYCAWLGRCRR